jgi:hypothetical protein
MVCSSEDDTYIIMAKNLKNKSQIPEGIHHDVDCLVSTLEPLEQENCG